MTESGKAVFLSYASQDAEAARRICEALRAAGVEVWFDQNELTGGDAWDAKIRKQIKECALFVPIISANTQARREGYFRIEWKLAAQRTHAIAEGTPFLLPLLIDDTSEPKALVPSEFREVQWTRITDDRAAAAFCARANALLMGARASPPASASSAGGTPAPPVASRRRWLLPAIIGIAAVISLALWQPWQRGEKTAAPANAAASPAVPLSESQRLIARIAAIDEKEADASREEWDLAEKLGAQAIKLEPANAEAWAAFAQAALGRMIVFDYKSIAPLDEALKRAQQTVALAPESIEGRLALARCFVFDGRTRTEAEAILRSLAALQPGDRRVWRTLAAVTQLQGKNEEALTLYDRADGQPGGDPVACRLKATLLTGLDRFDEAEAVLDRSLALRSGPAAQLLKVQFLTLVRDDLPGAAAIVQKMPGSYFLREEITEWVARLWMWKREPARAVGVLTNWSGSFLRGHPKGLVLGQAYQRLSRPEAAQLAWRAALRDVEKEILAVGTGSNPNLFYFKACLLACLGEVAAADEAHRTWEQLAPAAGVLKATLLMLLGRHQEVLNSLPKTPWRGLAPAAMTIGRLADQGGNYRYDPIWDPLRGDPRIAALIAKTKRGASEQTSPAATAPSAKADSKSIAVLAFRQLSADPDNEYLCEALSDELCNVLGRVPGLRVAASASAFSFKGKRVRPSEMAAQLGVAYLVDGSVQKIGSRVRVTATLIKASDETPVWRSEPLELEVKDMFAMQDAVVGAITKNLQLQLGSGAPPAATINPEAHKLYVAGRHEWNLRNDAAVDRAEKLFNQALAIDPTFSRALVALADTWLIRGQNQGDLGSFAARDGAELARIRATAGRGLALLPSSAEAHATLGSVHSHAWRGTDAEREYRAAIALNPNYATAHQWLGRQLATHARLDEALVELQRAAELDPLSARIVDNYSWGLLLAGRYSEAVAQADKALAVQPDARQARGWKVWALTELSRHDEAIATGRPLAEGRADIAYAYALARAGRKKEAREVLSRHGPVTAIDSVELYAQVFAALGDWEQCFATLTADRVNQLTVPILYYSSAFDPIRNDPRLLAVLQTVGLGRQHAEAQAWRALHPPEESARK